MKVRSEWGEEFKSIEFDSKEEMESSLEELKREGWNRYSGLSLGFRGNEKNNIYTFIRYYHIDSNGRKYIIND